MRNSFETSAAAATFAGAAPQQTARAGLGQTLRGTGKRRFPRRSRRGVSIWGVVLGVAVVAFFALQIVGSFQGVMDNSRGQQVNTSVLQASTGIRRVYANASSFPTTAAQMNPIIYSNAPANLQNTSGSSSTAGIAFPWWGGSATLTATAGTADTFTLSVSNLPSSICETVAAAHIGLADIARVDIRGSGSNSATTRIYVNTRTDAQNATDAAKIGTRCGDGTLANRSVHIEFRG